VITELARTLIAVQEPDGAWRDFDLPPGLSDAWVTAYVVAALRETGPSLEIETSVDRATAFLAQAAHDSGGWGYNKRTPPDADSTAWTLLAVGDRLDVEQTDKAIRFLCSLQRSDGGFSTYRGGSDDNWAQSHPDVTPTVVRSLHRTGTVPDVVERGIQAIFKARMDDGLWPSFWWTTPLFATLESILALDECGYAWSPGHLPETLFSTEWQAGAFDKALALAIAGRLGRDEHVRQDWSGQEARLGHGGLLRSRRILQLPARTARQTSCFADPFGIFTSATVMRCLSMKHIAGESLRQESHASGVAP
jgi:hypothetical protein